MSTLTPARAASDFRPRNVLASRLRVLAGAPSLIAAAGVLLLVLGWAFFPSLFSTHDPLYGIVADRQQAPSAAHWFGTDNLGRDVFGRVVYGSSESLRATTLAVLMGFIGGSVIGLIAGFVGGAVDTALMRVVDVLLAIPSLLLSLMVVTALGFGTTNVAIAVGVAAVASFARVMRAEVLRLRTFAFVESAVGLGLSWPVVVWRHVLPNSLGPVLALAALEFGTAVLSVAALSFLGYGNPPPAPEWGSLISDGRNYLATSWWLTALPGLVVVAVVVSANRLSRGISPGKADRK